ncbi:MAG: translational GTPase TypA [Deltaproteobacteria bacterium]|nr:translational GTPase TypA [Deltaproteobacteria bacterium]
MTRRQDVRNIAIIAHVDHGKTTLVDAMLQQAGVFAAHEQLKDRVMDSMDQERERGITIQAKNTGIQLGDVHVNIVDTPGHADFGGEVERTLHMVDGVLLLVDAAEGPLPQTRFVLEKALEMGLSPMVVINKVDRHDARPEEVLQEVYDLFIDLDADENQLTFPVIYAVARDGWAIEGEPMGDVPEPAQLPQSANMKGKLDLKPLFNMIIERIPGPEANVDAPLQLLANAIAYDDYLGRMAMGRIKQGSIKRRQDIVRHGKNDLLKAGKAAAIFTFKGLARVEVEEAKAGDIVVVAGFTEVEPGDTIGLPDGAGPIARFAVDEPTLSMMFSVNDGPLGGIDGKYVTSRHLRERLFKEAERNVALRVAETDAPDTFKVSGRGELSLAVLIEQMRREGYEMLVSRPQVVVKEIDGKKVEPMEGLVADLPESAVGGVTEVIGKRGGAMESMGSVNGGRVRVEYRIPTRGLIGFRNMFLTLSRGEGIMSTFFHSWIPYLGEIESRKAGVMVSNAKGKTTPYALYNLQPRGEMFIKESTDVYEGMIIGEHSKSNDLDVNCTREKKLTNVRTAGKDEAVTLSPPRSLRLEEAMEYIDMDELVEITPSNLRMRKRILVANMRTKGKKLKNEAK